MLDLISVLRRKTYLLIVGGESRFFIESPADNTTPKVSQLYVISDDLD